MKIYLATDHAAFELKEYVKKGLSEGGYDVEDCGALSFDPHDDYPDIIKIAAQRVAQNPGSFGVVLENRERERQSLQIKLKECGQLLHLTKKMYVSQENTITQTLFRSALNLLQTNRQLPSFGFL